MCVRWNIGDNKAVLPKKKTLNQHKEKLVTRFFGPLKGREKTIADITSKTNM